MRYYIGPLQFSVINGFGARRPPVGTIGMVDLSTIPAMSAQATGGAAFIATDSLLPSEYALLGTGDLRGILSDTPMRDAWRAHTGYRPNGDKLVDLLFDQLMLGSDPDGAVACCPIMPDTTGWMDLWLHGHSKVKGLRFEWGDSHTPKVQAVVQRNLMDVRTAAQAGRMRGKGGQPDTEFHRKVMQALIEKFRVDFEDLRPAGWPVAERPLPHETTITDNFTRADGDTIGNLLTWTEAEGDWDTVSNQIVNQNAASNDARAESDVSGTDAYSKILVASVTNVFAAAGAAVRFSASAATYYVGRTQRDGSIWDLYKRINGSYTFLESNGIGWASPSNNVLKTEANGSTIKLYQDDVEKLSVTDTSISGNTRGGVHGYNAGTTLDNFEVGDIGAGGGGILYTQLERGTRGLVRGVYGGSL